MPATRPTNADPNPKHNEDTNVIDPSATPFSIHFDKLVIAVGAYSQSDCSKRIRFLMAESFPQLSTYRESKNTPIFWKMLRTPGEYGVVSWNVCWNFLYYYYISSNVSAGFEQANQPFLTDIERRHLLNFCVVGMPFLSWWLDQNVNSNAQVVVQRVSNSRLNYTIFSIQTWLNIIRRWLNWLRLPSTMSHPIFLGLLINRWEGISLLFY